jgi:hypothetical protein
MPNATGPAKPSTGPKLTQPAVEWDKPPAVKVHPDQAARRPDVYGGIENAVISAGKRIALVAREARDIPTAIGNAYSPNQSKWEPSKLRETADMKDNLIKQVKETITAATTGKKGTTSDQYNSKTTGYTPGKQRK